MDNSAQIKPSTSTVAIKSHSIAVKLFGSLLNIGALLGPTFVHSDHGVALLNASEAALATELSILFENHAPAAPSA